MLLGTLFGFLAVSLVHNTIGNYIAHSDSATALNLLAALWVAWPFYSRAWSARKALLHPPVRRYKLPHKQAFAKVRQILSNTTYNFGDKWYVSSADTMRKRITACLRFTDEEQRIDLSSHHTSLRKDRKQRLLELEVQMEEEPDDSTIIQFDFRATVEGVSWHACDRIIYAFLDDVQTQLGAAEIVNQQKVPARVAPPWWLIAITVLCLLNLTGAVGNHISNSWQKAGMDGDSSRPTEIAAGVRRTGR
jgi:hypothetical protein